MSWLSYTDNRPQHTVVGDLRVYPNFPTMQLGDARDIFVWLPPTYADESRRFPVMYMHDAQNLFDAVTSYAGEWQVDETMTSLSAEGLDAIIVAIPNHPTRRRVEYNPFPYPTPENGAGEAHLDFLCDNLKPLIDSDFRTLPDREHTGIAGSSMGGLISLYGFVTRPQVFSMCGCFSPAYWIGGNLLAQAVRSRGTGAGKVHLDIGTREGGIFPGLAALWENLTDKHDNDYVNGVRDLRNALIERGWTMGETLRYIEDEGAFHNEAAWAARLPDAMRFLLR